MTKCEKNPTCGIFLKRGLFKDIKNDISMFQKRKYKGIQFLLSAADQLEVNMHQNNESTNELHWCYR